MESHFRNLVFEGGGVKGIAYVGAMEVLEEKGVLPSVARVGGTSAGAINATMVGLGYTPAETGEVLWELDFESFLDDEWGIVRDKRRLLKDYGWYRGDFFRDWVGKVIARKTGNANATFRDVHAQKHIHPFRDLYLVGTNLCTGFAAVFSHEHTPTMRIADAVRISMSIPLFFTARRTEDGDLWVDGGMLDNYPVKLFDRTKFVERHAVRTDYYEEQNRTLRREDGRVPEYVYNQETLGFRLDSEREIAVFRDGRPPESRSIDDFFDYAWSLVGTLMNAQSDRHLHSDDWQRTIYIDTLGVGTTEFGLSDERKEALVASGRAHTERYFQWFEDPAAAPANRPVGEGAPDVSAPPPRPGDRPTETRPTG